MLLGEGSSYWSDRQEAPGEVTVGPALRLPKRVSTTWPMAGVHWACCILLAGLWEDVGKDPKPAEKEIAHRSSQRNREEEGKAGEVQHCLWAACGEGNSWR